MDKFKRILILFLEFMKFGCFTFGGGWSIIAQMNKLYVVEKKTITNEELLDITSVGRSLPGTMIGNVALIYGYHAAGVTGSIACVIGMMLPPLCILIAVTFFYSAFRDNSWVAAAMTGVRSAVVPIIVSAGIGLIKGAHKYSPCILVTLLTFSLYLFFGVGCIWLVLVGLVCGLLISEYYERKEDGV